MTMLQQSTEAQIAGNLSPCYQPIFEDIRRQKIYSGERIFYAADFTGNYNIGSVDFGFMIFTDRRYLKVYLLTDAIGGISYFKSGSNWNTVLGQKVDNRRWMDPYGVRKESYWAKLKLADYKFSDFAYSEIKGVIKNDYSVQYKSEHISLVELRLEFYGRSGDIYKTFKHRDGAFIHDLLNDAIQNHGNLSYELAEQKEASSNSDVTQLLNALVYLHKSGLLTDGEFEQKKQEVLAKQASGGQPA